MIGAAAAYMSGLFFALFFTDIKGILIYVSAAAAVFIYGRRRGFSIADHAIIAVSFVSAVIISLSYTAYNYDRIVAYDGEKGSFTGSVTEIRHYEDGKNAYTLKGRINGTVPAKICFYSGELGAQTGDNISFEKCTFFKPEDSYLYASERIYRSRHIFLKASILSGIRVEHTNRRLLKRKLDSYRDKMIAEFKSELGNECGSFLAGMVFGDKTDFDENTRTVLYRTGIGHVLAVSGLHVSIIASLIWTLLSRLNVNRFAAFAVMNVLLLVMTAMANYPVSALRAAIMLDIMYSAKLFRRQNDSFNSLAVAALIIAVSDPYSVCSAGFLLSLSGTFGIALFAPYMTKKMERETAFQQFTVSLVTGICTTLAVFPVSLWFFDETSVISPLANLILVPMCTAAMVIGFIYVFTFGLLPILPLAGNIIRSVIFLSDKIASVGIFHVSDSTGTLRALLIVCAAAVVFFHMFRKSRRLTAVLTAAGVAAVSVWSAAYGLFRRSVCTVAVLGSGANAAVVVMHDGHTCIADLSGNKRSAEYVRKYLMVNGVISTDTVILTKNAESEYPLYEYELGLFGVKNWIVSGDEKVGDSFIVEGDGYKLDYDSGTLRVSSEDTDIVFVPAVSGKSDGDLTVFYGRYKKENAPYSENDTDRQNIDLYTDGNNLEITADADRFRIRRL